MLGESKVLPLFLVLIMEMLRSINQSNIYIFGIIIYNNIFCINFTEFYSVDTTNNIMLIISSNLTMN